MTDIANITVLVVAILIVAISCAAVITKAVKEGSLQADVRYVRRYARRQINHYTTR